MNLHPWKALKYITAPVLLVFVALVWVLYSINYLCKYVFGPRKVVGKLTYASDKSYSQTHIKERDYSLLERENFVTNK